MKKIGFALASAAAVMAAGLAGAAAYQGASEFHGVRVLTDFDMERSGPGVQPPVTAALGPYDTNAVLLVKWSGQVDGRSGIQYRLTLQDGAETEVDGAPRGTSDAPATIRVRRDERLFLARGETKTLVASFSGAAEAEPSDIRLQVTAIAAPR